MRHDHKRLILSPWHAFGVGGCVLLFVGLSGCQRLGVAVAEYLPERREKAAAAPASNETADDSSEPDAADSSPMGNMGGGVGGGDFAGPADDDMGDEDLNFGPGEDMDLDPDNGDDFDPIDGETMENGSLEAPDDTSDPGAFPGESELGENGGPGQLLDGNPATGTTGGVDQPTNRQGSGSRNTRSRRSRNSKVPSINGKVAPPKGRPLMVIEASAIVPVLTQQGQRMSFSLHYQLDHGGLSAQGQYGLLIESSKAGRFRLPVELREEGAIQVPGVLQFRPGSGPYKAYLIQVTNKGMQRISNEVTFKTLR